MFRVTRPILVVPSVKSPEDGKAIQNFEEENTLYAEEMGLFIRRPRRISPQEYFDAQFSRGVDPEGHSDHGFGAY